MKSVAIGLGLSAKNRVTTGRCFQLKQHAFIMRGRSA